MFQLPYPLNRQLASHFHEKGREKTSLTRQRKETEGKELSAENRDTENKGKKNKQVDTELGHTSKQDREISILIFWLFRHLNE